MPEMCLTTQPSSLVYFTLNILSGDRSFNHLAFAYFRLSTVVMKQAVFIRYPIAGYFYEVGLMISCIKQRYWQWLTQNIT